jgi:hypothetical protein
MQEQDLFNRQSDYLTVFAQNVVARATIFRHVTVKDISYESLRFHKIVISSISLSPFPAIRNCFFISFNDVRYLHSVFKYTGVDGKA